MGFLERGGKVRTAIVKDRYAATLHPQVKEHVQAGAVLYSDALYGYRGLESEYSTKSSTMPFNMWMAAYTLMALRISGRF